MFGVNEKDFKMLKRRVRELENIVFLLTANLSTCLDKMKEPQNREGVLWSDVMMDQIQLSFDECYLTDPSEASHFIISRTGSKRVNTLPP